MTEMKRRDVLSLAGAAGLGMMLPTAHAAEGADLAQAKAEGKAVFYANITAVQPIMKAFDAATGVKGEYTRISSTQFLPTVLTESGAGKLLADVLQAPRPIMTLVEDNKVLAEYVSPSSKGYPDWAVKDPRITLFGIEYMSYLFNTQHVKPADAPQRYEDLADPKWKGQIVMPNPANHASTISWLLGLREHVFKTDDDWMAFCKGVAANQPMFVASLGPTPAPIESGEKLIAISMPKYIVTKKPAPLAWGPRGGQPLMGTPRAIAITEKAPHPAAARVFMDYWLSKDAMSLMAKNVGEYVLAPGVFPDIEGIDQVKVLPVKDLSDAEIEKWGRQFGRIFGTR